VAAVDEALAADAAADSFWTAKLRTYTGCFSGLMKDVTAIFDHYRVSVRSIWNTAFWPDPELRDWDSVDQFRSVEKILFDALVLTKLDKVIPPEDVFRKPISFLSVTASSPSVPIMIQCPRPEKPIGYWDDPIDRLTPGVEMHFLSFFDWNELDYRDLQYYRVSIARFDEHPHLIGREALISRHYAKVSLGRNEPVRIK
jgi:hypothetical protein